VKPSTIGFLVTLSLAPAVTAQSVLDCVWQVGVDSLAGQLTVYYSPGHSAHAEKISTLLNQDFLPILRNSLGFENDKSLALLSKTAWGALQSCWIHP
jgi:hypothetical protein